MHNIVSLNKKGHGKRWPTLAKVKPSSPRNNLMILCFPDNCNDLEEVQIYLRILDNIVKILCSIKCPGCNSSQNIRYHDTYIRNITYVSNDEVLSSAVEIARVMCSSCIKTHAILPDDIIPYKNYTNSFVFHCLKLHFIELQTISQISIITNTYDRLINRLIEEFKSKFTPIFLFLKNLFTHKIQENNNLIKYIYEEFSNINRFLFEFYSHTKDILFLKKRRNILSGKILFSCQKIHI